MEEKGAEAPPIDTEGTLRNIDWLEADQTRKAEVRVRSEETRSVSVLILISVDVLCLLRNKRLTLTIMTRFADVNKKEQKGATHSVKNSENNVSPPEDGSCLIPVYSVDTAWENRNHKNLIRLIISVSVERKRLIFNTDVEVVWIGTIRSNT
ncbi:hypothetical protein T06_9974 [Trichinella sp. T6]|nr:hypothetical protein T06_9974 [Trichinella sp. T6]